MILERVPAFENKSSVEANLIKSIDSELKDRWDSAGRSIFKLLNTDDTQDLDGLFYWGEFEEKMKELDNLLSQPPVLTPFIVDTYKDNILRLFPSLVQGIVLDEIVYLMRGKYRLKWNPADGPEVKNPVQKPITNRVMVLKNWYLSDKGIEDRKTATMWRNESTKRYQKSLELVKKPAKIEELQALKTLLTDYPEIIKQIDTDISKMHPHQKK